MVLKNNSISKQQKLYTLSKERKFESVKVVEKEKSFMEFEIVITTVRKGQFAVLKWILNYQQPFDEEEDDFCLFISVF